MFIVEYCALLREILEEIVEDQGFVNRRVLDAVYEGVWDNYAEAGTVDPRYRNAIKRDVHVAYACSLVTIS